MGYGNKLHGCGNILYGLRQNFSTNYIIYINRTILNRFARNQKINNSMPYNYRNLHDRKPTTKERMQARKREISTAIKQDYEWKGFG